MARGALLQLDQPGSVESLDNSPDASLRQLPQSRQASRELVRARVDGMIILQSCESWELGTGNEEQAPETSDGSPVPAVSSPNISLSTDLAAFRPCA